MSQLIDSVLRSLPTFSHRCSEVVDQLARGRSVLWLFPKGAPREMAVDVVLRECQKRGLDHRAVTVSGAEPPLIELWRSVHGRAPRQVPDLRQLVAHNDTARLYVLQGLQDLDSVTQAKWLDLLVSWSRAVQQASSFEPPDYLPRVLLVPLEGSAPVEERSDTYLVTMRFWGWATLSETRLIARVVAEEVGLTYERALWLECVSSELAVGDPGLLRELALECRRVQAVEDHVPTLREIGSGRGWDSQLLSQLRAHRFSIPVHSGNSHHLSKTEAELWHKGLLCWTPERGAEIHSAALAILGLEPEIRHRAWRGQVGFFLPLLDTLRLRLCAHVAHGPTVDFSMEFKELASSLSQAMPEGNRVYSSILTLKRCRDALAHAAPLRVTEFEDAIRAVRHIYADIDFSSGAFAV